MFTGALIESTLGIGGQGKVPPSACGLRSPSSAASGSLGKSWTKRCCFVLLCLLCVCVIVELLIMFVVLFELDQTFLGS